MRCCGGGDVSIRQPAGGGANWEIVPTKSKQQAPVGKER